MDRRFLSLSILLTIVSLHSVVSAEDARGLPSLHQSSMEKRGGGRSFAGFSGFFPSAKRYSHPLYPYYDKRGGGRAYFPVEMEKRGGGRAYSPMEEEKRGGGRAYFPVVKRGGGRAFAPMEKRGGGRSFVGDWSFNYPRYYDLPYYKRSRSDNLWSFLEDRQLF
ncbi:hypothetical protein PMAYCL1PPCAC_29454 [Pristionchus mayeri]|uniref:Uncharacterized protein n=1 Tax=Pristionchus mayeri TaxID=1317129 RepID=A0AAN5DCA6_9BILA|nr:hypothetical protein PMAYCL1PPCAC_29454 [Pristionchus mayeri]